MALLKDPGLSPFSLAEHFSSAIMSQIESTFQLINDHGVHSKSFIEKAIYVQENVSYLTTEGFS